MAVSMAVFSRGLSQSTEGKNMGKVNLSAFTLKGFNVQFERQLGPRITAALGYSNIPSSTLPYKSSIENVIDDPDVKVNDFRLGTSIFTPEVRYYFGKEGAFHGFYLAPYARIGTYKVQGPIGYSSDNTTRNALFSGKINTFTGGLMIGSSWQLSGKLYLDWWIAGAGFGGANGDLVATTSLDADEQASLKSELDDLDIPFTTIESEVNSNGATVTTTGNMAGVRGFGINLGIRF